MSRWRQMVRSVACAAGVAWLICGLGVATAACRGESVGEDPGGSSWGGLIPPDATVGCWPPPDQVQIHSAEVPCFVHSLHRVVGRLYVLGSSEGEGAGETTASLRILDGDSLEVLSLHEVDAAQVHARFDQWADDVVAAAVTGDEVRFQRYHLVGLNQLELAEDRLLCTGCAPLWGGPETVEHYSGMAVRDVDTEQVRVFVWGRDGSDEVLETPPVEAASACLTSTDDMLALLYVQDDQLWATRVGELAETTEASQLSVEPVRRLLASSNYRNDQLVAAVLAQDPSGARITFIKWDLDTGMERTSLVLADDFEVEGAVSFSPSTVAVSWGRAEGDVGAHFAAARMDELDGIFGPELVSDRVDQEQLDYPLWSATAHHPTGHAVVWGGWQDEGGHGIYGKIIPCLGGE